MRDQKIIAIIDLLANEIAGPLTIHRHDAAAIRFFGDVASHPESQIGRHIADYILVELGQLTDDLTINAEKRLILTGSQWKASQQQQQPETTN